MDSRQTPIQRGFTLIEALIALVVLSLGLLGLLQIQTRVMTETGNSKAQTAAVNLAQEKLEELRASDYSAIAGGEDLIPAATGGTTDFTRAWTVTPKTEPPYNEVSVTTRWTRPGRDSEGADFPSVTLTTFIAQSAAVALDTIGGANKGNGNDPSGENDSGDGDDPGGQDDSGDGDGDDEGGEEESDGDADVFGPGYCSCFYGKNQNDIKLLESKGACCTAIYCTESPPDGIKENTSFVTTCQP